MGALYRDTSTWGGKAMMNAITPLPRCAAKPDTRTVIDLEDLVTWAVRDQKADRNTVALFDVELEAFGHMQGWEPCGHSNDGCFRQDIIGGIGCHIDGSGALHGVAPRMHPDAEAVADAIERRSGRVCGLILQHARLGERPEWSAGQQMLMCVKVSDKKPGRFRHKVVGEWQDVPSQSAYAQRRLSRGLPIVDQYGRSLVRQPEPGQTFRLLEDGSRQAFVRHCPVEKYPSDAWVIMINDLYATWHSGMLALLNDLRRVEMRDHRISGFAAPALPWDG